MPYQDLKDKAKAIRNLILDMCVGAGTGHVSSSFSCVEILVALYYGKILRYDLGRPQWPDRDRFILSKGQASPLLYAVLADLGFFEKKALAKFCQAQGLFGVHLQHDVPGVEITAGSLGHGLGIGAGLALAARMNKKDYLTFVLLGDGECHEGSVWEAAMFAAHNQLENLVAIVDRNQLCATGFTEKMVKLNPFAEKWSAFGWDTAVINGHSFDEIIPALNRARSKPSHKPRVIIAQTIKGKGVSFMENQPLWHGVAPKDKQAVSAKKELSGGRK